MLKITIVSLSAIIYFLSLYGWGRVLERVFRIARPFPLTICTGMAAWIFLGGLLNLIGIARPMVLNGIVLAGLALSLPTLMRSSNLKAFFNNMRRRLSKDCLIRYVPSIVIIIIVFVFCAHTQSSPKTFNLADDLETYLNHPVRMLATGSLRGSPFNGLGSLTLGGQAFLQGFVVSNWPIGYANSVDSVFAFVLCLMIVFGTALSAGLPSWLIPLVVAAPVLVNPQYVNISAIYTAIALMLLLFLGPWLDFKDRNFKFAAWPHAASLALAYSALIALKNTYLLIVPVHFTLLLFGLISVSRPRKDVLSWAAKVIVSAVIFISPWMLLYYSNWIAVLLNSVSPENPVLAGRPQRTAESMNLFSLKPLFYGFGTCFAHYTYTAIVAAFCGVFLIRYRFPNQRRHKMRRMTALAACAALPILYLLNIFVIGPILWGPTGLLRYICPVIIAAVPSALIMASESVCDLTKPANLKNSPSRRPILIFGAFSFVLLITFFPSSLARAWQVVRYGSVLSFSQTATQPGYIEYTRHELGPLGRNAVRKAQQAVPEGQTLATWTARVTHLDYNRNRIIDITSPGLFAPWIYFPFTEESDEAVKYFTSSGVYYILWQYAPVIRTEPQFVQWMTSPYRGERVLAYRTWQFTKMLQKITGRSHILYDDGQIRVIKLPRNTP
ncbi:MAG: hypothetical protein JXN61_17560 [Sedimentisphaerales bacterium]|nr:hypothetical protein [Sedimentisphaerales bacterium]